MTTPIVPSVTDELIAELEILAARVTTPMVTIPLSSLITLLAKRADHLKIISERLEPASPGTKGKRKNWLENIREAQKFGLPKLLVGRLDNTAKEIENSIRYGGTSRLRDRISELEAERADHLQQLAAASVDAERYDWLREMHNDEYGCLWVSHWDYGQVAWVSLDAFYRPGYDGELDLDAAIDAARNIGSGD